LGFFGIFQGFFGIIDGFLGFSGFSGFSVLVKNSKDFRDSLRFFVGFGNHSLVSRDLFQDFLEFLRILFKNSKGF